MLSPLALFYPTAHQLEVFAADDDGAIKVAWKFENDDWNAPWPMTEPAFRGAGTPLAGTYYEPGSSLEVFVVGGDGRVYGLWKAPHVHDQWQPRFALPGVPGARAGAHLAALHYSAAQTLEVFFVGEDRGVHGFWKSPHVNHAWQLPFLLPGGGFAPPGAAIAAVEYPSAKTLEVFVAGDDGVIHGFWKAPHVSFEWQPPFDLPGGSFVPPGAPIAAVHYPPADTLEAFVVANDGALYGLWKAPYVGHRWQPPHRISPPGFLAEPGAPLSAVFYGPGDSLEVFLAGKDGRLWAFWKRGPDPSWRSAPLTDPDGVPPSAPLSCLSYPTGPQLEVFIGDPSHFARVLWKFQNQKWRPCAVPIGPRSGVEDVRDAETQRIQQVTGGLWFEIRGVPGVDLGANVTHQGTHYVFFGDVPRRVGETFRESDRDCVAVVSDLSSTQMSLKLVTAPDGYFAPFTIRLRSGEPRYPLRDETPMAAFSHGGFAYVFVLLHDRHENPEAGWWPWPVSYLTRAANPGTGQWFDEVFRWSGGQSLADVSQGQGSKFLQVAPVVVDNALVPGRESVPGQGLVILGCGVDHFGQNDAVHLAWMPLGPEPSFDALRYYTGHAVDRWSGREANAKPLWPMLPFYTSISATFVAAAERWIVLYSKAIRLTDAGKNVVLERVRGPIIARTAPAPTGPWSREIVVFDPCRDRAYGAFMHWPDLDTLQTQAYPDDDVPGWAYGAFIVAPLTEWHPRDRSVTLHYLMSTSRPYQVQLMRSRFGIDPA